MTLYLELAAARCEPIDARTLTPEHVAHLSLDRIRKLPLRVGRRTQELGELFRVWGAPSKQIEFSGHTQMLNFVGWRMQRGVIIVQGDAGLFAGAELRGGSIRVVGSCGSATASAMRGGTMIIEGDVADDGAAALGPDTLGMRGGVLIVQGDAGDRFAAQMRRGTAVVVGTTGDDACRQMIAGTVVALSGFGLRPGLGVRRGTLVTRAMPDPLPAWFSRPERYVSSFSRMLVRTINGLLPSSAPKLDIEFDRCLGDLSIGGQAELLVGRG